MGEYKERHWKSFRKEYENVRLYANARGDGPRGASDPASSRHRVAGGRDARDNRRAMRPLRISTPPGLCILPQLWDEPENGGVPGLWTEGRFELEGMRLLRLPAW